MKRTALLSIFMLGYLAIGSAAQAEQKPSVEVNLDVLDNAYGSTKVESQILPAITPASPTPPAAPKAPEQPAQLRSSGSAVPLKWIQVKKPANQVVTPIAKPLMTAPRAPVVAPVAKPVLERPLMTGPIVKPTAPVAPQVAPVKAVEIPAPKPVEVVSTPPAEAKALSEEAKPEISIAPDKADTADAPSATAPAPAPTHAALPPVVPAHEDLTLGFDTGSSDLSLDTQKKLDGVIMQMVDNENARLQLRAYAKADDETKSSARRLSLSRALAVRSYLMDQGVSPARVDVRALGAETDRNPLDRVDVVFVK